MKIPRFFLQVLLTDEPGNDCLGLVHLFFFSSWLLNPIFLIFYWRRHNVRVYQYPFELWASFLLCVVCKFADHLFIPLSESFINVLKSSGFRTKLWCIPLHALLYNRHWYFKLHELGMVVQPTVNLSDSETIHPIEFQWSTYSERT